MHLTTSHFTNNFSRVYRDSIVPPSYPLKKESPKKSCGNKHDTLVEMHDFLQKNPIEGVFVPLPHGVPSEEVELFLKENAPQFFRIWEELAEIYGDQHPLFFEDPRVISLISEAQAAIKTAFEGFEYSSEMEAWLQSSEYYMVRSSGSEDNKKTANAGGNKSCNYVKKEGVALCMGEVVASYIDKRSLSNRIKAGENPFKSPLQLSVTVQELIGEQVGGEKDPSKIPISLVLFSNEPLYVGKEAFRIMKLSATYGHGEGVVGNCSIPADTAFVLQSISHPGELYVWYDKQAKLERLAPLHSEQGVKLEPIANPAELADQRALSAEMIKRLYELGTSMEKLFDGPTDMELVIKEGKIFIVQARPINRSLSLPTYLDLDASSLQMQMEAKVLVPGSSSALVIDSAEQVLVEDTLEKAADALQKHHKLVISRDDEPLNSHPIIQMTEQNMPCFYHRDGMDSLISELQLGKPLAVCVQQGVVGLINDSSDVVEREGYITHPAPLSCPPDNMAWRKNKKAIPREVQALFKKIRLDQNQETALKVFKELAEMPLLQDLPGRITYKPLLPLAEEIQQRVNETLHELGEVLSKGAGRLQTLFYAKALETLLWGNGYSVLHLEENSASLSSYEQKLEGREAALAEESLIPPLIFETGNAWINFLLSLEKNHPREDIESLKQLLHCIGDARSLWLTFFFDPARKEAANSEILLKALLEEFDSDSQAFLSKMRRHEKLIDRFKTDLFADPSAQPYAFSQLKALIKPFEDPKTTEAFKKGSPLARIIYAQVLAKGVAVYDKAIKTLKTSNGRYSLPVKAQLFQEMLGPYFSLLRVSAMKLVGHGKFSFQGVSLREYLNKIESILNKPLDLSSPEKLTAILAPSPAFSVQAAVLGSGALFERHLPETLEDVFTLIHQNLNACVSYVLAKKLPLLDITPPPLFVEALDKLSHFRKTQLLGIEQESEQLVLNYNAPLRNHSSTFQLTFKEGRLFLSVQLLGQARLRWAETGHYLQTLDALSLQPLAKKFYQRGNLLSFDWCAEKVESFAQALEILNIIYEFSLNEENTAALYEDILARIKSSIRSESEQQEMFEKTALMAERCIAGDNVDKGWGFGMLCSLVDKGHPHSAKLSHALSVLGNDSNLALRVKCLTALVKFVKQGQFYDQALEVVQKSLEDQNKSTNDLSIAVLKTLIAKDYEGDKIAAMLAEFFDHLEPDSEKFSLILEPLKLLVDKGLGQAQALSIAFNLIEDKTEKGLYRSVACKILITLIHQGFACEDIAAFIEKFAVSQPENTRDVLDVIKTLTDKFLSDEEGVKLMARFVVNIRESGFILKFFNQLSSLVDQGRALDAIATAAEQFMNHNNQFITSCGFDLLKEIVRKGVEHEKVKSIAERLLHNDDKSKRELAEELFQEILNHSS